MLIIAPAGPSQVCREFQRGNCTRGESDCRYAHPLEAGMVDCSENSVIVCMDYIKGRCSRDKCKYFHPPAHLQARIKAAQHQASHNTASAGLVSPDTENSLFFLPKINIKPFSIICWNTHRWKPILTFTQICVTLQWNSRRFSCSLLGYCLLMQRRIRVSQYPSASLKFDNVVWGLCFFMNVCYCACTLSYKG